MSRFEEGAFIVEDAFGPVLGLAFSITVPGGDEGFWEPPTEVLWERDVARLHEVLGEWLEERGLRR